MASGATGVSGIPKDPNSFMDRNYPLNVQSFVPFALSQQQLYMQRQSQQQQAQNQDYLRQNKFRLPQINSSRDQQNEYGSTDGDEPSMIPLDPNVYSTKKTVMTIICLVIIIMSNSIQLKFVIRSSALVQNQFYSAQVGIGVLSILLSAFTGVLLMYEAIMDFNDVYQHRKLEYLNNLAIVMMFILMVLNVFLVAFYG